VRVLVMPVFLNWDLWANSQVTVKWLSEGLAGMYADPRAAYPPVTYGLMRVWMEVLDKTVARGVVEWIRLPELVALFDGRIYRYLFWLKVPWVGAEMMAGWMLSRLVKKEWRLKTLWWWMLNPVVIYTVAAFANVDAWPVMLILVAVWWWRKGKKNVSAGMLGLATAMKLFPVLLAPFWFVAEKSWRKRLVWLVWFLAPVVLLHMPVVGLESYGQGVLGGTNVGKVFYATVEVGLERMLIIFVAAYVFLWLWFVDRGEKSVNGLWRLMMVVIGGLFVLTDFHVQWALWLMAFVVGYVVALGKKEKWEVWIWLGGYGTLLLLLQASMHVGMLAPVEPTWWMMKNPAQQFIGADWGLVLGLVHSVMAGSLGWMVWRSMKDKLVVVEEK